MAPKAQFTLEEITKIALGAPELTNTSVHVLHSLIDVILKKIGCQNDTVSICGVEADCLAEMLNKSKSTPLTFDDRQLTVITPKLQAITQLAKCINEIETKLNNHIQTARNFSQLPQTKFNINDWEHFNVQAESQCIPCEGDHDMACYLTGNIDFLKKLQRRLAEPMVLNLLEFEQEIAALNADMNGLIESASENLEKLALMEGCLLAVEKLRTEIEQHNYKFLGTMEEVQDILDFKLDKIQIPALKRYVLINLNRIETQIRNIQNTVDCPKPPGVITTGLRCLSCGDRHVCAEKGVHATGMLPDAHPFKPIRLPRVCKCTKEAEPKGTGQKILSAAAIPGYSKNRNTCNKLSTENFVSIDECEARCLESFNLLQGTDGSLYRKG